MTNSSLICQLPGAVFDFLLLDVSYDVGSALVKWIYTDAFEANSNVDFLLSLLRCAGHYKLSPLMIR